MKTKSLLLPGIFAISVALTMFFYSCEKEDDNSISQEDILIFKNNQEYHDARLKSLTLSENDRRSWEESLGFKSFGTCSEDFYWKIDPGQFKSEEEVKNFVRDNSEFVRLIKDDNGEFVLEPVMIEKRERYIMNVDRLFQIKDTVYRVFNNGIASVEKSDISLLMPYNENNYYSMSSNPEIVFIKNEDIKQLKAYWCGTYDYDTRTSGKERVKLTIKTYRYCGGYGCKAETSYDIRPYRKTLGVWYWCSRTINAHIQMAVVVGNSSNTTIKEYNALHSDQSASRIYYPFTDDSWNDPYFTAYDCCAKIPATNWATVQCNNTYFD